jgi:DNA-binding NarL/FixJ family response regulator
MNPGGATSQPSHFLQLAEQDTELTALIALGVSNCDIAGRLNISEQELKQRVSRLLAKLDLKERIELIFYAHTDPQIRKQVLALAAQGNSAA